MKNKGSDEEKNNFINTIKYNFTKYKIMVVKLFNDSKRSLIYGLEDVSSNPLEKCRKAFKWSVIFNFFIINILVISLIKKNNYVSISLTLLLLGLISSFITFFSCGHIYSMIKDGKLKAIDGVVTRKYRINVIKSGIVEVMADDEKFYEFVLESDIKVKKKRKYRFFYYELNNNKIVTAVNYIGTVIDNKDLEE